MVTGFGAFGKRNDTSHPNPDGVVIACLDLFGGMCIKWRGGIILFDLCANVLNSGVKGRGVRRVNQELIHGLTHASYIFYLGEKATQTVEVILDTLHRLSTNPPTTTTRRSNRASASVDGFGPRL